MSVQIVTKNSETAGSAPAADSLVKGELAINVKDQKLFSKDADGNVFEFGPQMAANTLQQVTDAGNTTTNDIEIGGKIELKGSNGSITAAGGIASKKTDTTYTETFTSGLPDAGFVLDGTGTDSLVGRSSTLLFRPSSNAIATINAVCEDTSNNTALTFQTRRAGETDEHLRIASDGSITAAGNVKTNGSVTLDTDTNTPDTEQTIEFRDRKTDTAAIQVGYIKSIREREKAKWDLSFGTNATTNDGASEVLRLTAGGSAKFSGPVSIGGMDDAHTIDEYEEGTMNALDFYIGNDAVGLESSDRLGTYTRIGNVCHCTIILKISASKASGKTGNLTVRGLPFKAPNTPRSNYITFAISVQGFANDYRLGNKTIYGGISANADSFVLKCGDYGTGTLTEADLNFSYGTCNIYANFTYRIDD